MILYFSATGNTRLIAEALAHELNDECVSLLQRIRESDYSDIHSRNPFIFCAPVYYKSLPESPCLQTWDERSFFFF